LFKRADAVTAVSESLLRDLIGLYPFVRHKAQVIHNSLGPSWLQTALETRGAEQERYVLFVGFFHTIKGVDVLLRAWQKIQERKSGIALWLVGDGPELNSLRSLSEELGLRESVRFVGAKQQTELISLYRNAEVVVVPSRSEGLPRVALEAGACGSICVAANVGGLPEVIEDQVTGFLVEPESPEALAKAMLQVFDLPLEKKQRMRAAARKKIESQFTQEQMIANYEALFKSLNGRQHD
jgi:glycosyltransferase involved in cell wall biosynthesis